MTTATLPLATGLSAAESAVSAAKSDVSAAESARRSLLRRCYDALVEARMRQAMREVAMHRHLVPDDILKSAGHAAGLANDREQPFTRSA
jgi:hypothetical protein